MAEVLLDQAQVDSRLQKVRRVAVAKRVDGDPLVEPDLFGHLTYGVLNGLGVDGLASEADVLAAVTGRRKEEATIAVREPVATQHLERALRKRHAAIDRALSPAHVHERTSSVDVTDLKGDALGEPEAEGVDGPKAGSTPGATDRLDDAMDLLDAQHRRQLRLRRYAKSFERLPVARHGDLEELLDATVGDLQRPGGELAVDAKVNEVLADLVFGNRVGRLLEELRELAYGAHVDFAAALAKTGELKVLLESST